MRTPTSLLIALVLLLAGCHGRLRNPDVAPATKVSSAKDAEIRTWPWPDHVTGEERARIEDAIRTIWDVGGREARDAEEDLVSLDRDAAASGFRAVGRLVSEMKTVIDRQGLEGYEGKSRLMVLDRILRQIDGVQERLFGEEYGLDIEGSAARALKVCRTWNWWYDEGRFLRRYEPWDLREDAEEYTEGDEKDDPDLDPLD